ncbi:MAG: sigma-70 family RNA polymerase sigma factor [Myxococcales bacterium]|nr:sigma-70 family RNA polymerase sigma factor [Myxococcales bacterium]
MLEDWELLDRWRGGEKRAGAELLRRYFGLLSRIFYNKVATREDAADLVSDTLLACTASKDRVKDGASFRAYVTAIALNQLRLYYRKRHKRQREREDFLACCVAELDAPASPYARLARRREELLLVQALRSIPLEYQLALELHLFEGLNGREIAELLGLPNATVYTRIRRAREQLTRAVERLSRDQAECASTLTSLAGWAQQIRLRIPTGP